MAASTTPTPCGRSQITHWLRHAISFQGALLALAASCLLASPVLQAQTTGSPYAPVIDAGGPGGLMRLDVLGARFSPPPAVAPSQSRIVLYRSPQSSDGAVTIFVNDRYHDSLVPGAWSQLCHSSGPAEFGVRHVVTGARPAKDRYDSISALTLQAGQVHYLSVSEQNARPVLRPVAPEQALQEIASAREQVHTVSRAAQDCLQAPPTPAPAPAAVPAPVPVRTYTLQADTLFAFDRSDRAAMTDAGTRAIDTLLANIQRDFSRIERVHLIGHADPLGQPERNERLAIERANTVRGYIAQTGLLPSPLTAEGRGSREPVVRHCGTTPTAQAIACNLPNRRVTVEVTGVRR